MVRRLPVFALLVSLCLAPCMLGAQPAIQPTIDITKVPAAAQPSDHFDADAATEAYMAMMPPAAIARSNAYFEGGYWLILWDFLVAPAIGLLLLQTRWSARMRESAERITRFRWLQNAIYWIQYLVITSILGIPLAWYEGLYREQHGLATQTFGPWMGDQFKAFLISPSSALSSLSSSWQWCAPLPASGGSGARSWASFSRWCWLPLRPSISSRSLTRSLASTTRA